MDTLCIGAHNISLSIKSFSNVHVSINNILFAATFTDMYVCHDQLSILFTSSVNLLGSIKRQLPARISKTSDDHIFLLKTRKSFSRQVRRDYKSADNVVKAIEVFYLKPK